MFDSVADMPLESHTTATRTTITVMMLFFSNWKPNILLDFILCSIYRNRDTYNKHQNQRFSRP